MPRNTNQRRRARWNPSRVWKCCGKEGFQSWIDAEVRRSDVEVWYGITFRVYRCRHGRYHLTSKRPHQPREENERR